MIKNKINLKNINIYNKNKSKEIIGGHSGAHLYKININKNDYCIKVFNDELSDLKLKRIEEICNIYQKLSINSLKFLGYEKLENENKYLYAYNYIDGNNLKTISNLQYSKEKIYNTGIEIGKKLKKLKEYNLPKDTTIETDDIDKLSMYIIKLYNEIINNKKVLNIMHEYFDMNQIKELIKNINEYKEIFKNIHPKLIHGDIKRSNIMVDKDGINYIIDIESMKKSYDVLNFRYQITWYLTPEDNNEIYFIKGFFDGLYDYIRPENFNEQIIFVIMLNFIEHISKITNNEDKLRNYCDLTKDIFYMLKNINRNIV